MGVECDRLLCERFHTARMSSLTIPGVNLQHKEFRSFSVCIKKVRNQVRIGNANSEGPEIIGSQRGCLHFPRLHLYLVNEMARIPSESGLFYALNCGRVKGKSLDYHLLLYRAIVVNVKQ